MSSHPPSRPAAAGAPAADAAPPRPAVIPRLEDVRLVSGAGRYTDDHPEVPGELALVFVRSPFAHGAIRRLDVDAARRAPDVVAVLTIDDLDAAGVNDPQPSAVSPEAPGASPCALPQPALARGVVRYVGEPVAAVVAASAEAALDAAELVALDVDEAPAVATLDDALAEGAAELSPDVAPGNVLAVRTRGDASATDAAFAAAAHVVEVTLVNNRVAPVTMEPRGALAVPASADAGAGVGDADDTGGTPPELTVYTGTQGVHAIARDLAAALSMPVQALRVVTGDVGGGFGMRLFLQGETTVTAFAARHLGRAVRWIATRSESFLGDLHGRDHRSHAALALDAGLRFTALRVRTASNVGAYTSSMAANIAWFGGSMATGAYDIPAAFSETLLVVSNTAPVDAYRGAGRPEASYLIERLVDRAARELGVSPVDLRRRNFIQPKQFPYSSALGQSYDSGTYAALLDACWARGDGDGFAARRERARADGRLAGLGLAYYVEVCAGFGSESPQVQFDADGGVEVRVGTQSTGQGHETAFAQLVAERFGVAPSAVRVVQGDTAAIRRGGGTGGSRTLAIGGSALARTLDAVEDAGARVAAGLLEAAAADVRFADGRFTVVGTDHGVSLAEVVAASHDERRRPQDVAPGLRSSVRYEAEGGTFPNGCHLCEVAVDPQTGVVEILRYTVQDDMGRVRNPQLLAGQIVGGAVQGLSQALCEAVVYERGGAQLLTGTFVDYAILRAAGTPRIDLAWTEVPSPRNPLGVKGAGEAGTIGAPAALVNAVLDALAPLGVTHLDMPLTPLRVWQAIRAAGAGGVAPA